MGNVRELKSDNFDSVIRSGGVVLVDFWAPWCGPCKMQAPILDKISQDNAVKATIAKLNTDDSPDIAQKYGISSIPTLILFKDGTEVDRLVGVQSEAGLKQKLAGL